MQMLMGKKNWVLTYPPLSILKQFTTFEFSALVGQFNNFSDLPPEGLTLHIYHDRSSYIYSCLLWLNFEVVIIITVVNVINMEKITNNKNKLEHTYVQTDTIQYSILNFLNYICQ